MIQYKIIAIKGNKNHTPKKKVKQISKVRFNI